MITCEDDVRAYVREASLGKARWVEPALGSTPGLPDCWVPYGDRQVHLELKCATVSRGMIRYTLRPEQRREIIAMKDDGVAVGLLVGVRWTNTFMFLRPTPATLLGRFSMAANAQDRFELCDRAPVHFWAGVFFIFSDFQ